MKLIITKISSVLMLAVFIIAITTQKDPRNLDYESMQKSILDRLPMKNCQQADTLRFKRSFSLNAEQYEYVIYFEPVSNMDVTELLIVKLKEGGDLTDLLEAAKKRIETQKKNFDGYGTNQMDILKDAVIYSVGDYVCLFIGDNSKEMERIFKEIVEV